MKKENYLFSVLKTNSFWFSCTPQLCCGVSEAKGGIAKSKKPPTTGDRLRAQHQWHARFARGGFSTMIFPIKEMATPPVKIHWWK
ncbi:MAG TPA: hypothetical protein VJI98_02065, partial [Candidatus Nanoarchaeia archaeon]|nr:hypothetical protein [Candidatus Nanoarchaeia archaeon]